MCHPQTADVSSFYHHDIANAELKVYEAVSQLVVQRFHEPHSESNKGKLMTKLEK